MEAPSAVALVRDLAEDIAPVDLSGQVAALAAEKRSCLCDPLKQHHHLSIQGLQQPAAPFRGMRLVEKVLLGTAQTITMFFTKTINKSNGILSRQSLQQPAQQGHRHTDGKYPALYLD